MYPWHLSHGDLFPAAHLPVVASVATRTLTHSELVLYYPCEEPGLDPGRPFTPHVRRSSHLTPTSLAASTVAFTSWARTIATPCSMAGRAPVSMVSRLMNELGEGDGTVEIKLTPTIDQPNTLKVTAAFGRIDATGMMGEALRSGELGENLRDEAAKLLLLAARAGSDFKVVPPPAVQNSATIQSARFQDENVGGLGLVLEGQADLSNEQTSQLADQLNQALSAQAAPSPEPASGTVPGS